MSKRVRLIIILVLIGISCVFLYPSFRWYVLVPQGLKDISAGSRTDVRNYVVNESDDIFTRLEADATAGSKEAVSTDIDFLVAQSRKNYRAIGRSVPATWTAAAVLGGFRDKAEVFQVLEDHFRQQLLSL